MENLYFEWLIEQVSRTRSQRVKYTKLFWRLYHTEYQFDNPMDANRESDGIDLRYHFGYENDIPDEKIRATIDSVPWCTVFEMMVALAIRMENIMYDLQERRNDKWFWAMIKSLGLENQTNERYDRLYVDHCIDIWFAREFDSVTGKGGLITLQDNRGRDLTRVEIWCMAMWYLSEVTEVI